MLLRIAALAPRVRVTGARAEPLGGGLSRVSAVVENVGYLPTYVLSSAKALPWNDPLHARLVPGEGVALAGGDGHASPSATWRAGAGTRGRTRPRSRARERAPVRRRVGWVVRGAGSVEIHAAAARVGSVRARVEVPG